MRVYFLGAGASKSLSATGNGLPLAGELTIRHLLDLSNYSYGNPDLQSAISNLTSRISALDLDKSVEDLLPEITEDAPLYRDLRICLVSRLWLPPQWGTAEMTNWLGNVASNKDVLITTNYDTLLERAIYQYGAKGKPGPARRKDIGLIGYGVPGKLLAEDYQGLARNMSPNAILLLKLHGSVSWSYCENCKQAVLDPTYMGQALDVLVGSACTRCQSALSPILVGPARKLYNHPIINSIYTAALDTLSHTTEIIFAGFSLNQSDEKIEELLKHSHKIAQRTTVVLVDPNAERLLARYKAIYGDAVTCHPQKSWKAYLIATFPPASIDHT